MAEVVDRRALGGHARLERRDHGVAQPGDLAALEPVGRAQRVDPRAVERLVGVDVPHAGDLALVEQERLHRRAARARERVQVRAREVGRERLHAEPPREERLPRRRAERELAGAEAARVVEHQPAAAGEAEGHAAVARRLGRVEQQRARHPQVHEQVDVVLQREDQVLAAAVELLHRPALHGGGELLAGERARPALVVHVERLQHPALEVRREMAADRLDLGHLRHALEGGTRVSRWPRRARAATSPPTCAAPCRSSAARAGR